jgi:murein L,D-transpeptidase YcbB/YkuD
MRIFKLQFAVFFALAALLTLVGPVYAQDPAASNEIRERIERFQVSGQLIISGQDIAARDVLWILYEDGNYAPLWTRRQQVDQMIDLVGKAEEEGLLPRDYHYKTLVEIQRAGTPTPGAVADFDILLTDSLLRYFYHLLFGKVNPSDLDSDWNLSRRLDLDPKALIAGAIAADDIRVYVAEALNWELYYKQMRQLLAEYRERAAREGGGYEAVPTGPTLRKGMRGPRVASLRKRLQASEQLAPDPVDDPEYFDAALEQAVSRFQREAEIDVDGAVGAGTLAALNVSLQSRINQIRVNMERGRWILREIRDVNDFVIVNIADFKTFLFRDRQQVWQTRSQVGRTYRKTPVFSANMKYAQLNPTWTVPPGILRRDILPKMKADADGYLKEKDMKLVDNSTGAEVDPSTIDWAAATPRNFRYQVVQRPGPQNALGQAKFIFPNPHFVFLHDTNHREHFDDNVRTFSSGCIRIENPMEFARLVLNDPKWDADAIQGVIDSKQTKNINLKEPLPVLILYWTVNPITEDGSLEFLPDVYDRDDRILKALEAPFKFVPPDDFSSRLDELNTD